MKSYFSILEFLVILIILSESDYEVEKVQH